MDNEFGSTWSDSVGVRIAALAAIAALVAGWRWLAARGPEPLVEATGATAEAYSGSPGGIGQETKRLPVSR